MPRHYLVPVYFYAYDLLIHKYGVLLGKPYKNSLPHIFDQIHKKLLLLWGNRRPIVQHFFLLRRQRHCVAAIGKKL